MKICCKWRQEGWSHIQKNVTCSHIYMLDISTYTLCTYIRDLISSVGLFYTSLWKGIKRTTWMGQLGSICVSRGERELPELVTAQGSPWWISTSSKSEGSEGADKGAQGHPKSNTGCSGPLIAPDHHHSPRSRRRKHDAIQISFLSGPCCRFACKYYFDLVLAASWSESQCLV